MSVSSQPTSVSLVAVGCCLIVFGSGSVDALGPWHYLFYFGAIVLCILAIIRDVRS